MTWLAPTDTAKLGWALILIGFCGIAAGPFGAVVAIGVVLAWPRS